MQSLESDGKTAATLAGKKRVLRVHRRWPAAASVALLILASSLIYFQFIHNPEVLLATGFGQTLHATLPDSSEIVLNANSTLRYKKKMSRKVWLSGEAFFEIRKKSQTHENFQVFTNDLTITVLGTTFNVNSRNEQTRVFLEEGKVNLQLEDPERQIIEMAPGDLVSYSKKQNKVLENHQDDSLENTSWKEGVLLFADTPLPQALSQIADIYGVQFEIIDPVLEEKILSGGTPIRDLEITLQTLQEVFAINITKKDGKYLIDQ